MGFIVGDEVGLVVGLAVGCIVVGDTVGPSVGSLVGDDVGPTVGDDVGLSVGDNVGDDVGPLPTYSRRFGERLRLLSFPVVAILFNSSPILAWATPSLRSSATPPQT